MFERREKECERSQKDIEREKRKRERREEIYRNNERLYEVYWKRQKEIWLKEKELEREKNRELEQKKIREDKEKNGEKQLVIVVVEENERKFENKESDIVRINSEMDCQKEKIEIESEKENESCKLREKKEINEKVEGVKVKEKEKSKERKDKKSKEVKSEIERDIFSSKEMLTFSNSFCSSIVVPYIQKLDEDFSKSFLDGSIFFMKPPINLKGVQVLEWKGCKRLIFDPGIDLTPFHGGSEVLKFEDEFS